jgi:N-acetylmuramoyl-L-alanine amidase
MHMRFMFVYLYCLLGLLGVMVACNASTPTQQNVSSTLTENSIQKPTIDDEENLFEKYAGRQILALTPSLNLDTQIDSVQEKTLFPLMKQAMEQKKQPTLYTQPALTPNLISQKPLSLPLPTGGLSTNLGALKGKRIALSAGHGWKYSNGDWTLQRDRFEFEGCLNCRGIVEDIFTAELMTYHLIPLLESMGAHVVLVREPDFSIQQWVIDDGDAFVQEDGLWVDGTATSSGFQSDYRTNSDTDNGSILIQIPEIQGPQRVSLRYVSGTNRTTEARFSVFPYDHHIEYISWINQQQYGQYWIDLGLYQFASTQFETPRLLLSHGNSTGFLIFDALKIGGGVHTSSGNPWWQMSAQEYIQHWGAPINVSTESDVLVRPQFAEAVGADAYISIHANASGIEGGIPEGGISFFRYSCGQFDSFTASRSALSCDSPTGSTSLTHNIEDATVDELRTYWDPGLRNRSSFVANFGEVRELINIPGVLIETAYFDNVIKAPAARMSDNQALHDPRYREVLARGIAKGLARYFHSASSTPPLRPQAVSARNQSNGSLKIAWAPVEQATSYIVKKARLDIGNGQVFDTGVTITSGNEAIFDSSNLTENYLYSWTVSAVNTHGMSAPSIPVVAGFRISTETFADVLLINGFTRQDAWVQEQDNRGDLAILHGRMLQPFFESEFLIEGMDLQSFLQCTNCTSRNRVLYIAFGMEGNDEFPLTDALRVRIQEQLEMGGAVLINGENIATYAATHHEWDQLLKSYFGAKLNFDNVEETAFTATFSENETFSLLLDDGTQGSYEPQSPESLLPTLDNAQSILQYSSSAQSAGYYVPRAALFSIGLESLLPIETKATWISRWVAQLLLDTRTPDTDGGVIDGGVIDGGTEDAGESDGGHSDAGTEDANDGGPSQPSIPRPKRVYLAPAEGCQCNSQSNTSWECFALVILLFGIRRRRPKMSPIE